VNFEGLHTITERREVKLIGIFSVVWFLLPKIFKYGDIQSAILTPRTEHFVYIDRLPISSYAEFMNF